MLKRITGDEESRFGAKLTFSPSPLKRPPRMLMNPVCALFVTYYAYVYSCIYIFLVSLYACISRFRTRIRANVPSTSDPSSSPSTTRPFKSFRTTGQRAPRVSATSASVSLPLLPLAELADHHFFAGVGFLSAATVAANLADPIYKYCSARYNNDGQPEYRLVITQVSWPPSPRGSALTSDYPSLLQVGMCIFPLGVLMWAWTAQAQTHWILPLIGSAILGFALMSSFNSVRLSLSPSAFSRLYCRPQALSIYPKRAYPHPSLLSFPLPAFLHSLGARSSSLPFSCSSKTSSSTNLHPIALQPWRQPRS